RLAGGDSVEQVLRRFVSKAVEGQELFLCQVIEVRRVLDQLAVDQLLQRGVPQALDVERADKVSKMFEHLGRTGWVDAAGCGLARLPYQLRPTLGTFLGHVPRPARWRALLGQHADNLGDDVARALDDAVVAG